MGLNELSWTSFPYVELAPGQLRDGEQILHHWPAPAGMGILTDLRFLMATHPHPVHRLVLWSEELEKIRFFEVVKSPDAWVPGFFGRASGVGGGTPGSGWEKLDDYFGVYVDDVLVFVGYIDHCVAIQKWIDETRVARLEQLGWPKPTLPSPSGSLSPIGPGTP